MDGQLFDEHVYYWGDRLIVCEGKRGEIGGWVHR